MLRRRMKHFAMTLYLRTKLLTEVYVKAAVKHVDEMLSAVNFMKKFELESTEN
jgi:hypothetical protein